MSAAYYPDVILAPASVASRPGAIDRLNGILRDAGLGTPLGPCTTHPPGPAVIPVTGADPLAIRDAVRRAIDPEQDEEKELAKLTPDFRYVVDTIATYHASGERIGHGATHWLSAPGYEMGDRPDWLPGPTPPPVIALLDTEVDTGHVWLRDAQQADPPFVVDATTAYGWRPARRREADQRDNQREEAPYAGHGTFTAGLIRKHAPGAQVLSLPVMDGYGEVTLANVLSALACLDEVDVKVVLMPFGCRDTSGEDHSLLRDALAKLPECVSVVVSAGNDSSDRPVYPAAFAVEFADEKTRKRRLAVSVGARLSDTERAPFSNHGVWVREWAEGSNIVSLMPMAQDPEGGFAWWSGTSFAAAKYAAKYAAGLLNRA